MSRNTPRLCFIGFGEAGQAFASGLRGAGVTTMSAWDVLFANPAGARLRLIFRQRLWRLRNETPRVMA